MIVLQLVLAHLLGDFILQPTQWVEKRRKKGKGLVFRVYHVLVHMSLVALLTGFSVDTLWMIPVIGVSHFGIDFLKDRFYSKKRAVALFLLDQLAHLMVIAAVVWGHGVNFSHVELSWESIYALAIGLLLATYVSSVLIRMVLNSVLNELTDSKMDESMRKAGLIIGMLERVFVFAFVVLNYWQGIGFLLAAKSIFRFGDLSQKDHRIKTEYVLIGTLLSFGLAMLSGGLYNWIT
ncbi:MAG: DUF3307 domain-containing protein [Bacteroidetes bacterium]|nr:MAG: DUF3307 domain-containing protein [Bacteroidota bacterium]